MYHYRDSATTDIHVEMFKGQNQCLRVFLNNRIIWSFFEKKLAGLSIPRSSTYGLKGLSKRGAAKTGAERVNPNG